MLQLKNGILQTTVAVFQSLLGCFIHSSGAIKAKCMCFQSLLGCFYITCYRQISTDQYSFNPFWDASFIIENLLIVVANTFQSLLGCFLTIHSRLYEIITILFQSLLGCFPTASSYEALSVSVFQSLLGCFVKKCTKRQKESKNFQSLLGCFRVNGEKVHVSSQPFFQSLLGCFKIWKEKKEQKRNCSFNPFWDASFEKH